LEDPDIREYATRDPRSFLRGISEGAILDEAQRVPILFSYLQSWVEEHKRMGRYVLTGSQNFLMMEGISQSLAGRVAVLEASFLVYLSKPFHRNYGKRLVKSAKLHFTDPGLVCALQGITHPKQLETHYLRGALFETLVVSEILKHQTNRGRGPDCSFWRDQHGREVDCLLEEGGRTTAIEVKAGRTPNAEYFAGLEQWRRIAGPDAGETAVVYAGDSSEDRSTGRLVSWSAIESLFELPS
jgi:predicted AAA+ superfamily ATPase